MIAPRRQTNGATIAPTSGCHCLVVDISGSMSSDAQVTNDDGDKVRVRGRFWG